MEYLPLTPGISVSRLSLGTWSLSGSKNWGPNDENDSIRTIHLALDRGVNLLDSAARYNNGVAEEILGRAIKDRRDRAIVATKIYTHQLAYDDVITECDNCLRRLDTDYIDLFQIHWPSQTIPAEETMRAFEKLKADGKIRAIGVCNAGPGAIAGVAGHAVSNQLPYNLLWRQVEETIIPASLKAGLMIWPYCALAQGILTGKFSSVEDVPLPRREIRYYDSAWGQGLHKDGGFEKEIFAFVAALRKVAEEAGIPMGAIALNYLKTRPAVGSVMVGARNESQLLANLAMFETEVPSAVMKEAERLSDELKPKMGTNPDMWQSENGGRFF